MFNLKSLSKKYPFLSIRRSSLHFLCTVSLSKIQQQRRHKEQTSSLIRPRCESHGGPGAAADPTALASGVPAVPVAARSCRRRRRLFRPWGSPGRLRGSRPRSPPSVASRPGRADQHLVHGSGCGASCPTAPRSICTRSRATAGSSYVTAITHLRIILTDY